MTKMNMTSGIGKRVHIGMNEYGIVIFYTHSSEVTAEVLKQNIHIYIY